MQKKIIFGAVAAVALAAGGVFLTQSPTPAPAQAATAEVALLPDIPLGEESAPITMIEYASFTCSHCANFHETVYPQLKAEWIDTGKVKFILREVYFDQFGLQAAQVANCAGPMKYYPIGGMLFDGQAEWIGDGQPATVSANLKKIGLKAGLTAEAVDACLADEARAEQMVLAYQTRATADDVQGTPTLIINGVKHENMAYADLKKILEAELAN